MSDNKIIDTPKEIKKKNERCLITVEGGTGKSIMLTAIMPEIAKYYDEIYVVSPYVTVFKACSYVTDAFPMAQASSLYQELVLDEDTDILWKEPYSNSDFIRKKCHLFDAWASEFGIKLSKDAMLYTPILDRVPEVFPEIYNMAMNEAQKLGKFIIVQFCGGQSQYGNPQQPYTTQFEVIKRNYHNELELINELRRTYPDCNILHYGLPNEPAYEGTVKLNMDFLAYRVLAEHAFKVVCIDSSLQHLASGACKDTTVIWGETRPEHFGYRCNKNICAKNVINSQPYFKPLGVSPSIVKMPSVSDVMKEVMMVKSN